MAIYGIRAVKYCLSKNLLHYVDADAGGSTPEQIEVFNPATGKCTVTNPLTTLTCLIGTKATLTVDDAVVNRRHQYTARLTFVTATDPELDGEYYAFVVETNEGERMLLGSKVAPRCSVTTRQNVAATAGDVNGFTTTVDFKAPYAPLHLPAAAAPAPDTRSLDVCCGQIVQDRPADTRNLDVCCGAIAQDRPADTREFDVCCGEIKGEVPPTPPPPTPVAVFCPAEATEECSWEYISRQLSTGRLLSGFITDRRKVTRVPVYVDPTHSGYTDLQIFVKRYGHIVSMDFSPILEYIAYTPVYDTLEPNIVIGFTGPTWPSDKVAIIYAFEDDVPGGTGFFAIGLIWPKGELIPDVSVYPNATTPDADIHIDRPGYHCVGWSYRPGGQAITLGNATQHVVLHALWEPNT